MNLIQIKELMMIETNELCGAILFQVALECILKTTLRGKNNTSYFHTQNPNSDEAKKSF